MAYSAFVTMNFLLRFLRHMGNFLGQPFLLPHIERPVPDSIDADRSDQVLFGMMKALDEIDLLASVRVWKIYGRKCGTRMRREKIINIMKSGEIDKYKKRGPSARSKDSALSS